MPFSAILTGDLLASRRATPAAIDQSIAALHSAAQAMGRLYGFDPRFTRHRGDGWQCAITPPAQAFTAAIALTAALRAADTGLATRIAIGIGPVQSLGRTDLSDGAGAAFETSGDLLARMETDATPQRLQIDGAGVGNWPRAALDMADWIAQGWTKGQAEAVRVMLLEPDADTNEKRARRLGITRQAFESRLRGAGLDAMTTARHSFERLDFNEGPP